jgi:hypothetical protein
VLINVKALIPIVLEQDANNYSKWCGLFLVVLGKYAVTRHVLNDESFPERPAWLQTDCTVLTWIYGTVSNNLLQSLMLRQFSTRSTWHFLEGEFLGQSESHALLET